jgi:hypothetical protein
MNQEMLDRMIGQPPRSTVDLDRIITRQRRRVRLGRVAAGGSAAVAVVAVIAFGMNVAGHNTVPPPQPLASVPPSVVPSATGIQLREDQATLDQLQTALEKATKRYAPGVAWIYMPDVPGEKPLPDGHPKMWMNRDPLTFEGRSGVVAGGKKGGFYLSVRPTGTQPDGTIFPGQECDRLLASCETASTSTGLPMTHWVDKPSKKYVFYGTRITVAGGRWSVTLQAVNYFGGDGSAVSTKTPVLTLNQLDAITANIADQIAP